MIWTANGDAGVRGENTKRNHDTQPHTFAYNVLIRLGNVLDLEILQLRLEYVPLVPFAASTPLPSTRNKLLCPSVMVLPAYARLA